MLLTSALTGITAPEKPAGKWLARKPALRPRFPRKRPPHAERKTKIRASANPERRILIDLPRSRYLRTFVQWLETARPRFPFPVRITSRRRDCLTLTLDAYAGALTAYIQASDSCKWVNASIWAEWKGQCIDMVFDLDIETTHTATGHICGSCLPEYSQTYPSRESLWIDHNFKDFLASITKKMTPTNTLNLYVDENGSSWAKLGPPGAFEREDLIACIARDGTILHERDFLHRCD